MSDGRRNCAYDCIRALTSGIVPLLLLAAAMAGTQLGMAMAGAYSLAAFTAGCVGLLIVVGWLVCLGSVSIHSPASHLSRAPAAIPLPLTL